VGFDLTTRNFAGRDDTSRPRRPFFIVVKRWNLAPDFFTLLLDFKRLQTDFLKIWSEKIRPPHPPAKKLISESRWFPMTGQFIIISRRIAPPPMAPILLF
jgi:hypothetical protein